MTAPTIQSQDISVATIFQAFYAVPDYQREYVWQADQVEQLLRDVLNEQDQREVSRAPEYFIGSIVVCPGSDGVLDLSRYAEQEIEHIHPQKPDADAVAEFGVMENQAVTRQLGNLVLLEKSINASLRNRPYSHKKNVYRESQLLLTRALTERPKVGSNTMIDAAVAEIEPYATWNEAAVRQRQAHLTTLARRVWNI